MASSHRTLSYFDGVNLGRLATAPTLFSVALMVAGCPPSRVFAAYSAYGTASGTEVAKDIKVYSHNEHEGGQALPAGRPARLVRERLQYGVLTVRKKSPLDR